MRQVIQSFSTGELTVQEVPTPAVRAGSVLVRTAASLVSAGTERTAVGFAEQNLLGKARSRPDLVHQTLEKARREGILSTLEAVRSRLDQPMALGYSSSGTIIEVGAGLTGLQPGDRVACAGGGYAVHAELACVPRNLVVGIPARVDLESAAFATLAAIALQGIRLAEVRLGEVVAVIGLGLVGHLAAQMLRAAGCQVVGMDIQPQRAELARQMGAEAASTSDELRSLVARLSSGWGADAVLITADTKSNQPVELAGEIARDRAIVVAVGAVGLQVPRKLYYQKELDLRVSRSYGPGRYDPAYEEQGSDYPIGYVRWTEQRNMQAFVQLLAEGRISVKPLISHRFPIEQAPRAYDLIAGKTGKPFLGVLLTYSDRPDVSRRIELRSSPPTTRPGAGSAPASGSKARVGLLGAGNFATRVLLPAIKKVADAELVGVCTASGASARHAGDRFGFAYCTTDANALLQDPEINTVLVATRHHLHARQVAAALEAGKHVFCEKPLALNGDELRLVLQAHSLHGDCVLMVGYNRRFAPMVREMKAFLARTREPLLMHYRVNAGYIPPEHWVHDPAQGGGRIIGEVCHFVDLMTFLSGALPVRVTAQALPNGGRYHDDNVAITVEFADGSVGAISYVANGDKSFSKERLEVFGGDHVAILDDFRRLELVHDGRRRVRQSHLSQDKGHRAEWRAFMAAVCDGQSPPISLTEIVTVSLTTFGILGSLSHREPATISTDGFLAFQPQGG